LPELSQVCELKKMWELGLVDRYIFILALVLSFYFSDDGA
jgi:hypothetical protein